MVYTTSVSVSLPIFSSDLYEKAFTTNFILSRIESDKDRDIVFIHNTEICFLLSALSYPTMPKKQRAALAKAYIK